VIGRRYRWWLLGAGLIGPASVAWLVVVISTPSRPPASAYDRLNRIRLGMSEGEVSRIMGGSGTMRLWSLHIDMEGSMCNESYEIGNGWQVEVTFYDDKLREEKLRLYPRDPFYRRAWYSLQQRIPSLPDLPF
jgi:hypothetical protein